MQASRIHTLLYFIAAASVAACNGTDSDDNIRALQDAIERGRTEVRRHTEACEAADSMDEMHGEFGRHQEDMYDPMHEMDSAMNGMEEDSHCAMGGMMQMMDMDRDMHAEMSSHESDLNGSGSLTDARALCEDHEQDMSEIFDAMGSTLDGMACMMMR